MIKKYLESYPLIDSSAYIEKSAIIIKPLEDGEKEKIKISADNYVRYCKNYLNTID